jgi:DNA-binding LytR/AlgR family response regulator
VNTKLNQLALLLNSRLPLFISISVGVFLFTLFFQPFNIEKLDVNNMLLFLAGIGGIVFIMLFLVIILLPSIIQSKETNTPFLPPFLSIFLFLVLSTVAITFYLRYVGLVPITFLVVFKVVLLCLAPPIIIKVSETISELKFENKRLQKEKTTIQTQVNKYEEDYQNISIVFTSDNNSEHFTLHISEIVFIKSADNYVEIVYKEGTAFKKNLIRNTLKNIELQLKQYSNFIRCHRVSIVNIHYIETLNKKHNNYWLTIIGNTTQIPVSRQYLSKIKEIMQ